MPRPSARVLHAVAAAALIAAGAASGEAIAVPSKSDAAPQSYGTACGTLHVSTDTRTCTYTFRHTRTIETFVVPPTTAPVRITAVGATGAGGPDLRSRGATVTGSFSSLGGIPIFIVVGGEGWLDGYNGGGSGGGGGASDVRLGSPDLDHRIIVAGGGGGYGEQLVFDDQLGAPRFRLVKGGDAGQPGLGSGGQPGTATAGGAGGGSEWAPGRSGTFGRGGGGGGSGLYGGGDGGGCAGSDAKGSLCLDSQPGSGGGGSSLLPPGGTFVLSDQSPSSITITVTQYGWWQIP